MMKYRALTFFESIHREEYHTFLSQPFKIGMVGFNRFERLDNTEPLFDGFRGSKMPSWITFKNDDGVAIDFYTNGTPYKIVNSKSITNKDFTFPYPRNINDFICDCQRCGVTLHWSEYALLINDIKNLLNIDDYMNYINNLLERLGKL